MNYKKIYEILKKRRPLTITILFALLCFIIWFLFSDIFIKIFTTNTKVLYVLNLYRYWLLYLLSVIIVFIIARYYLKKAKVSFDEKKKLEDSYFILIENLREEYFFYRHTRDEIFENITPSIKNILGYTPENFKNNYAKYGAQKLVDNYLQRHEELFKSGIKHPPIEIEVLDSENKKRILEIKEIPIFNENMEIVAVEGIARDITELKNIKQELDDQIKRYNLLFESSNDAILILKGGKILDCNQAALHLFKCEIDQIIMQGPFSYKFSPPIQKDGRSSIDKGREYLLRALKGEEIKFNWSFIRINGEKFFSKAYLKPFNYLNEDYIQLLIDEIPDSELDNSEYDEDTFRGMYENSIVGFFRASLNNGAIISCNKSAANILGYNDKKELIDSNFIINSFYPVEDQNLSLLSIVENKKQLYDYPVKLTSKDNSTKFFSLCIDINEKEKCYEGSILDITDRKIAEIKITENERKFREILDNSRILLYKLDAQTGDYQYISPAVKNILGYKPDEILAMDVNDIKSLLHPDDLGKAKDIIAKLIKEIPGNRTEYTVEYRMKNKFGKYRWLSDSYKLIKDKKGKLVSIIGNIIDITIQKETQEALRESEQRFRKMADNIQNGVTINENGKNIYVNDRLCEITGYSKEELLSFDDFQLAAPEEKKRINDILNKLKETGDNLQEIEYWIIRKDKTRACILSRYSYNYLSKNNLIKYIITSDITDRKMLEKALVESEEKFEMLAEMLPQTVFECSLEGKVTYVNQKGLKMFGYSKDDLSKGFTIFDIIIPEQKDLLTQNLNKLIENKYNLSSEYIAKTKTGKEIPIVIYTNVILDAENNPAGIRGIIIDSTNQNKIQEELRLAKEAAEAANKAKSIFLTNISHELRTPMNSIFGMTEIIKKTKLTDRQYDFLKVISESSETLLSFLNDIIIIPQIENNQITLDNVAFKPSDIMASSVGLVSYQAELKKIKINEILNVDEDVVVISDPAKLNQLLINLFELLIKCCDNNVIDFTLNQVDASKNNVQIKFEISTNCIKLPPDLIDSINKDFSLIHPQIYNKYGSQGLGFLIANQLIKIFNSKLEIEFNDRFVLSFIITFNRGSDKDLESLKPKSIAEKNLMKNQLRNVKILVAEDEIFNQLVIQTLMEEWDCDVDVVETGEEVIEKLNTNTYDIILMDIVMPKMSGLEATKYIRTKLPTNVKDIPIIGITAYSTPEKIKEYLNQGIDYIIQKPFRSGDLFHVLVKSIYKKDKGYISIDKDRQETYKKAKSDKKYDLKIIENIAKNNKVLINKMLTVFIQKTSDEIKSLQKYFDDYNIPELRNLLHKMIPAVGYMGCENVKSDLELLQEKVRAGAQKKDLKPLVNKIEVSLNDIIESLKSEIENYK
ncbi:MAG: hypothetical protein Kow0068_18380 [Marinilabiliales bacterium]